MNKNSSSSDFNLFLASDAQLGVLEAIYELMAEIPAGGTPAHTQWANALTGLAWAGRRAAREMNVFLTEASDLHRFPTTYSEIVPDAERNTVRESAAVYSIRPH